MQASLTAIEPATLKASSDESTSWWLPPVQNKANPLAMLQSAVLMLQHIGEMSAAKRIQDSIVKVLDSGPEHRTRDIGGKGTTSDFTAAMCATLRRGTRAGD